jgi:hypothetical protein
MMIFRILWYTNNCDNNKVKSIFFCIFVLDSSGVNMINSQINQARLSIREKQEQKMKQMRAREKEKIQPEPKLRDRKSVL